MLYVKEGMTSKLLKSLSNGNREFFPVEINRGKKKWLTTSYYDSQKKFVKEHLTCLTRETDSQSSDQDSILLLGDFNSEPTENLWKPFPKYTTSKIL